MRDEVCFVSPEQAPWVEAMEGVWIRMLHVQSDDRGYSAMFRFAPGTRLPRHHHLGVVHAYTLEGQWRYVETGFLAGPGSYVYEIAGSSHTLEVPQDADGPAVVFFVVEGGMVLLADDGAPLMIWDTRAMADLYASGLGGQA
jgi:quercetin dioxygenase-like cupin family protein